MGTGASLGGRSPRSYPLSTLIYDNAASPKPLSYTRIGPGETDRFTAWLGVFVPKLVTNFYSVVIDTLSSEQRVDGMLDVYLSFSGASIAAGNMLRDVRQHEVAGTSFSLQILELPRAVFGAFRNTLISNCRIETVSTGSSLEHKWDIVATDMQRNAVR
jgi:hypothetical protein